MSKTLIKTNKPKLTTPKQFQVLLLNDDKTTMEFVVEVLQRFFAKSYYKAYELMMQIHTKGKGVCGVYSFDIAQTKVQQVLNYARKHHQPLMCILKKI